jgi:hypothetical protein
VKEGLEWLDEHRESAKDEVETKKKEWEDAIRPVMMKLYAAEAGKPGAADSGAEGEGAAPRVEEVD